jgi:hypothetical protein
MNKRPELGTPRKGSLIFANPLGTAFSDANPQQKQRVIAAMLVVVDVLVPHQSSCRATSLC